MKLRKKPRMEPGKSLEFISRKTIYNKALKKTRNKGRIKPKKA